MRIKIISNGDIDGPRVVNADTGEELEGVMSVHVRIDSFGTTATVQVFNPPLEIVPDAVVETASDVCALCKTRPVAPDKSVCEKCWKIYA